MKLVYIPYCLLFLLMLSGCQMVITPEPSVGPMPSTTDKPIATPEAIQTESAKIYSDPRGHFTVPIPIHWTVETKDDYTVLASPQSEIQISILTVPGENLEAALAEAWAIVDPAFALEQEQHIELPLDGDFEASIVLRYASDPAAEEIYYGLARSNQGMVYSLLIQANHVAFEQLRAQVNIVDTGFAIMAVEPSRMAELEPARVTDEIVAEMENFIQTQLARFSIPGTTVVIVQDGEIFYANGFGVRDLDSNEPMTPETLLMINSVGKSMTTMMMATLVDDGLITWDTPVQLVLPQFQVADPTLSEQITMRNMVCACTGMPRRDLEIFYNYDELNAEAVIDSLQTFEFFTGFGEAFQYSNQMIAVAGYAAAAAASAQNSNLHEHYVAEMEQRIFAPISMGSTTFSFDEALAGQHALPHSLNNNEEYILIDLELEHWVIPLAPASGAWSNVLDIGRYLITLLNAGVAPDGTQVVSAKNLAATWEPQVPISFDASYGLGWIVSDYEGARMISHEGGSFGFSSELAFLPDAGIGIAILTNGDTTQIFNEAIRMRLMELIYDQPPRSEGRLRLLESDIRYWMDEVMGTLVAVDVLEVAPLLGRYTNEALGEIELRLEDDRFILDVGEIIFELRARGDGIGTERQYVTYDLLLPGIPIVSRKIADGGIELVLGQGADAHTFSRVE